MTVSNRWLLSGLLLLAAGVAAQPTAAQSFARTVAAHAWANQPTAATYAPDADYAFNAVGGSVTATRTAVGAYALTFGGLGLAAAGGSVAVTTYNSAVSCTVVRWEDSGADLLIRVECRTAAGTLTDSEYDVLFMTAAGIVVQPGIAYAWANDPAAASYTPNTARSYNPAGGGTGTVTATRSGVGTYTMRFNGYVPATGGHVQVTPYGSVAHGRCAVTGWGEAVGSLEIEVRCSSGTGALADYPYLVQFVEGSAVDGELAYAWANDETSASYTPNVLYAANGAGGTLTATRVGEGLYAMRFRGMGGQTRGSHAQVTRYGTPSGFCKTDGWGAQGVDAQVLVSCYDAAGALQDATYTVLCVWPKRMPVAGEAAPGAGAFALRAPAPNPATGRTTLAFRLDRPATVRLVVVDALGREVAVLADGALAAGDHAVALEASRLPAGVYLVRLDAGGRTATQRLTLVR